MTQAIVSFLSPLLGMPLDFSGDPGLASRLKNRDAGAMAQGAGVDENASAVCDGQTINAGRLRRKWISYTLRRFARV